MLKYANIQHSVSFFFFNPNRFLGLFQRFNLYSEEIAGISLRQFVCAGRESLCIVALGCSLLLAVYLQRGSLGVGEIESSLHALSKCESD